MTPFLMTPQWMLPTVAKALQTTRVGGLSVGEYAGFNLGDHVGDAPSVVTQHRTWLDQALPSPPIWLQQVHGITVVDAAKVQAGVVADASFTTQAGVVCVTMTADCLPVLLCDQAGTVVAAVHAGWRSLCGGIIEATVAAMTAATGLASHQLQAWLGPAIGPQAFEVGAEVRAAFMQADPQAEAAFIPHGEKFLANLYQLAAQRLARVGVTQISGGTHCTYTEQATFYSYRRDGVTGRMASCIWIPQPA